MSNNAFEIIKKKKKKKKDGLSWLFVVVWIMSKLSGTSVTNWYKK